eukprot:scaffold29816_cov49-Attheya_sp.AAC.2
MQESEGGSMSSYQAFLAWEYSYCTKPTHRSSGVSPTFLTVKTEVEEAKHTTHPFGLPDVDMDMVMKLRVFNEKHWAASTSNKTTHNVVATAMVQPERRNIFFPLSP